MYACSEYSFLNPVYVTHIIYSGNEDASRILYTMAKTCTYNVFRQAGAYVFGTYFRGAGYGFHAEKKGTYAEGLFPRGRIQLLHHITVSEQCKKACGEPCGAVTSCGQ